MQSWLLWNMIGLYPVTGQTTFLIHSSWFEHLKINLGNGKDIVVNSTGGDKDTSIHVQSLKVNGGDWKNQSLTWDDVFATRGTVNFVLGPTPNPSWFEAEDILPPSPASSPSPAGPRSNVPIETVQGAEPSPEA
jgi:putative alpha-1,2-mannosidase